MINSYTYRARVLRVIDGATLDVEVDLGFCIFSKQRVRLYGIGTKNTTVKKAVYAWLGHHRARQVLWGAEDRLLVPGEVIIEVHDAKAMLQNKLGRWLVMMYYPEIPLGDLPGQETSLNEWLVTEGHAQKKEY